ncbi:MAG: hypothetical protein WC861_05840 [Candidatus Micrarchaeia archaeon]|jgi:hypothetical protein
MRFSHNKYQGVRYARNICKAYAITGRITRNANSLGAMPFYRSLMLYRGLMQLEKSAKSREDFMSGRQLIYFYSSDHCTDDFDKLMRLKKDAALECYSCLRDGQMEGVARAKAVSDRWRIAPISLFLGKLMEAYADIRATRRGEATPLPPVAASKAPGKGNGENAYRGEMRAQAQFEQFFTSACRLAGGCRQGIGTI